MCFFELFCCCVPQLTFSLLNETKICQNLADVSELTNTIINFTDSSDSVSRELVEAGLVDGKDMIVGKLL